MCIKKENRLQTGVITFARMKILAGIISYLFHPLLFPLYGSVLILGLNPNLFDETMYGKWLIVVFALTFLFPVVWISMMKGLGMINSLKLETSKERIVPFVATLTFYLWATWMFKSNVHLKIQGNKVIYYMMMGACISISIVFFLNSFTKISLHTLGAGSIIGLLMVLVRFSTFDIRWLFVGAILLGGVIGTARLILKAHTEREVVYGYLIGFIGQFTAFGVLSRFF